MSGSVTVTLRPGGAQAPQSLPSSDRNVVDWAAVSNKPIVNAGSGLTGGGSLETDITLSIPAGGITSSMLASDVFPVSSIAANAVGTTQLQDAAVTTAELGNLAVTTAKLAADAVTDAKVATAAAIDSNKLSFTQAGTGAAARAVRAKLRDMVSVKDFGATGDGTTDDTTSIQAAETAIAAAGGGVLHFPRGLYKISATLTKRASNILWLGEGNGQQHDAGAGNDYASALTWAGSAGGTMIDFAPASGGANRRISGGGIVGLGLYGGSSAATGLSTKSVTSAQFDIYVEGFTTQGMYSGVVASLGEAKDFRENKIRVYGKQVGASDGYILKIDGDSTANSCYNDIDVRGLYKNATAFVLGSSDNNLVRQWTFRFGGGAALGVDCLGGATAQDAARANVWLQCYAGDGGFKVRGTADYTVASTGHVVLSWDTDNVQPDPTIGTGSSITRIDQTGKITWTDAYLNRSAANRMEFGGVGGRVLRTISAAGSDSNLDVSHGVALVSLTAVSPTATNVDLGLSTKGTGVGALYGNNYGTRVFKWNSTGVGFNDTNPIAKPTVTGSKGANAALTSLLTALANYGLITDSST